jgi:hypothetical protein
MVNLAVALKPALFAAVLPLTDQFLIGFAPCWVGFSERAKRISPLSCYLGGISGLPQRLTP